MVEKTCCPPYTIRLEAERFKPGRDLRRCLNRLNRYLSGDTLSPAVGGDQNMLGAQVKGGRGGGGQRRIERERAPETSSSGALRGELAHALAVAVEGAVAEGEMPQVASACATGARMQVYCLSEARRAGLPGAPSGGGESFFSALPRALAGAMQKEGLPTEPAAVVETLLPRLEGILGDRAKVMPVNGFLNFLCDGGGARGGGSEGGGQACGEDKKPRPSHGRAWSGGPARGKVEGQEEGSRAGGGSEKKLEISFVRPECSEEVFSLYKKYQMEVHNETEDEISKEAFTHFLVETPLTSVSRAEDPSAPSIGYGSHHMQFRIDGRLVAVSAVDVLPRCLSSKYAFWDPDLAHLSLGKVTACKEIEWVRQASLESPQLSYYYMGFYIDTCPKMAYKADYKPSELLCVKNLQWYPAEQAKSALKQQQERGAYVPLSEALADGEGKGSGTGACGGDADPGRAVVDDLRLMLAPNCVVTPKWLRQQQRVPKAALEALEEPLREVIKVCGSELAGRLVLMLGKGAKGGDGEGAVERRTTV